MRKLLMIVLLVIILCLSLSACTKRYVGTRINYYHPQICVIYQLPKSCTINTEHFMFDFTISAGEEPGEYFITGGATYQRADIFSSMLHGGMGDSHFYLLVANDSIIIDSLSLNIRGSLGQRLSFKRKFKSIPFDAVGIAYDITLRS